MESSKKKKQTAILTLLGTSQWEALHIASNSIFLAVVWGGSTLELVAFTNGLYERVFAILPLLDHGVALPSLGTCCLSGVALAGAKRRHDEPDLDHTMQVLLGFGVFWVVADKVTQAYDNPLEVFFVRLLVTNLGSCILSGYLYFLMQQMKKRMKTRMEQASRKVR